MLLTNSAKGGIVVNKYRCESNRHFTDKEHDGKKCPYDDMSASELSEEIAINIPQNEFQAYNRVREVGKQYGLSDKETHAIHRYVNSFNDGWYKRINQALRDGTPISKQDELICKHLDNALDKLPKHKGDLLRTINLNEDALNIFLKQHKVGYMVKYPSYTSTTSSSIEQMNGNINIKILGASKGVDLRYFNPTQSEILYKRNSLFRVGKITVQNNKYTFYLTEI